MANPTQHTRKPNRLAREKSPYLLQHQHNPVAWFAWGEEAFAKARSADKPIFLSIGYSTCHWCHVMERESFEVQAVADVLNEFFVSIKVDREERPDVDKIYMTFVQAMTGQGGWPLNVFLAPDLKPFYGGTYWPPETKYGRPGFRQVLEQIHRAWQNRREQLTQSSRELHRRLEEMSHRQSSGTLILGPDVIEHAGAQLAQGYDPVNGGFGSAPKFPTPSHVSFLLRYGVAAADEERVNMVLHTCERMAAGGIYDQLGGGFSRYSVDAQWLVPHFEKMLYDNAQLLNLYLDAFLVSGRPDFAAVAHDIIRYVRRDMTHAEGGFYSAEDADSEGKEGKFYCWTYEDLSRLLTPEEFNVAVRYFGITRAGNFVDHSDPDPLTGQNVLSIADPNLPAADKPLLESARSKMFRERGQRVRPHLDDKILSSWNGLMLGAMARASAVLANDDYLAAAQRAWSFLHDKLWDGKTRTLYHRWRDGERDNVQLLEAYAFLLAGTLDLYEVTLAEEHLQFAVALAEALLERFYDPAEGGFWQSVAGVNDLILRFKEDYDGAEPSGNSVAILSLLRLGQITGRKEFTEAAEKSLRLFADRLRELPQAVSYMLGALDFSLREPRRVVLAGEAHDPGMRALLQQIHQLYQPNKVVLGTSASADELARAMKPVQGRPTAYVCAGSACRPPTDDPAQIRAWLK